jgi:hypothetical protein
MAPRSRRRSTGAERGGQESAGILTRLRAILLGGLTIGVLDILDAFVFVGLRSGAQPMRILQSIAGGLIGRPAALAGGWSTAMLGLGLHFFIATTIAAVYVLACRLVPKLARHPLVFGPIYGIVAYLVMNLVVLPLSASPPAAFPSGAPLINGLLIHMFGVGLPAAYFASKKDL